MIAMGYNKEIFKRIVEISDAPVMHACMHANSCNSKKFACSVFINLNYIFTFPPNVKRFFLNTTTK